MSLTIVHNEETEDFLEHFGVKGMHWGVRRSSGEPSAGARNRQLNKASRAADKATQKTEVHAARARAFGGENKAKMAAAKEQYKADKVRIGSREAKKAFNKVAESNLADLNKANEYADGKDFLKDLAISTVGGRLAPAVRLAMISREGKKAARG